MGKRRLTIITELLKVGWVYNDTVGMRNGMAIRGKDLEVSCDVMDTDQ